jgi:hypothetical protein
MLRSSTRDRFPPTDLHRQISTDGFPQADFHRRISTDAFPRTDCLRTNYGMLYLLSMYWNISTLWFYALFWITSCQYTHCISGIYSRTFCPYCLYTSATASSPESAPKTQQLSSTMKEAIVHSAEKVPLTTALKVVLIR